MVEFHKKPIAIRRKAWLFADTPKGATTNAVLYTIVESAKANELDVYEHLNYLLTELHELGYVHKKVPEILDKYLSWSEQLPETVRLKQKRTLATTHLGLGTEWNGNSSSVFKTSY